jgi:ribonuclease HI
VQGLSGSNERTTNNRMEMTAVLEALRAVPRGEVTVVTDSLYVVRGMTKHLASWQTGGWETRAGLPVRNRDLWEAISEVSGDRVRWVHVHSHAGHAWNERADRQARRASIAS